MTHLPLIRDALDKTADARHWIGAGAGALMGGIQGVRHEEGDARRDLLMRDMGAMPQHVFEMRAGRRGTGVLANAAAGAIGGAVAGHYAPQVVPHVVEQGAGILRGIGRPIGAGVAEGAAEAAKAHAPGVKQYVGDMASHATQRAMDGGAEKVRGAATSAIPGWMRRLVTEE